MFHFRQYRELELRVFPAPDLQPHNPSFENVKIFSFITNQQQVNYLHLASCTCRILCYYAQNSWDQIPLVGKNITFS